MKNKKQRQEQSAKKMDRMNSMLDVMGKQQIQIEVTDGMVEDIKEVLHSHMWERQEGLRKLLGLGVGALKAQEILDTSPAGKEAQRLKHELSLCEGRMGGIRFELAEARQILQNWELTSGAIRELNLTLEQTIQKQNAHIDDLQAQLKQQEEEIARLRGQKLPGT